LVTIYNQYEFLSGNESVENKQWLGHPSTSETNMQNNGKEGNSFNVHTYKGIMQYLQSDVQKMETRKISQCLPASL
jgi:hypothetical protein